MFIGHWAPAMVAAAYPKTPRLGTLFVAAQLVDLAFFTLVLADIEHMRFVAGTSVMNPMDLYDMPYTHSLLGSAVWAAGFAMLLWLWRRGLPFSLTFALTGGAVVLSHWFGDLLVHVPDLTLYGAPPTLGFGLWNYPAIAMPLELALTFGALFFYLIRTRATSNQSRLAVGILAILLLTVQVINWFGPPPEGDPRGGAAAVVLGTYAVLALVAAWVSRTRVHRRAA